VIETVSDANSTDGRRKLGVGWIDVGYDDDFSGWLEAVRPTFYNGTKPASLRFQLDGHDYDDDEEDNDTSL